MSNGTNINDISSIENQLNGIISPNDSRIQLLEILKEATDPSNRITTSMEKENKKYYSGVVINQESDWQLLLEYVLKTADNVEFNILFNHYSESEEIRSLSDYIILTGARKDKLYPSGRFIRYKLSEEVTKYIKSKKFSEWNNYFFEDISFLCRDKEILATITHQKEIIMLLSEIEKGQLKQLGLDFWCEWKSDH